MILVIGRRRFPSFWFASWSRLVGLMGRDPRGWYWKQGLSDWFFRWFGWNFLIFPNYFLYIILREWRPWSKIDFPLQRSILSTFYIYPFTWFFPLHKPLDFIARSIHSVEIDLIFAFVIKSVLNHPRLVPSILLSSSSLCICIHVDVLKSVSLIEVDYFYPIQWSENEFLGAKMHF